MTAWTLCGVEAAEVVGQRGADRARELGPVPRRPLGLDVGERSLDHHGRRPRLGGRFLPGDVENVLRDLGEASGDFGAELPIPPFQPLLNRFSVVGLRATGRERGLALQPVSFERVRRSPEFRLERIDQRRGLRGDRPPARREQVEDLLPDPTNLTGLAIRPGRELHAERAGEVFFHRALADRGGGAAVTVEGTAVQCAPLTVSTLDAVQDRVVDVQLRVVVAVVVLEERRDRPFMGVHVASSVTAVVSNPGVPGVFSEVVQRGLVPGPDGRLDRLTMDSPRLRRRPSHRVYGLRLPAPRTRCAAR